MITKFLNWIKNFFPKEEKDPHLELYEDTPEPEIPVYVPFVCSTHARFKKSCADCQKQAQEHGR
tara:strand:+ start:461 stop:652 length:192 start_codon:yes stop_codon:yes gene_type:complete